MKESTSRFTRRFVASLGILLVAACGGGGGGTHSLSPNPLPSISSISPSSATAGGPALTLTVNGTNFVAESTIQWMGSNRATAYLSATQLTASITAADIAKAGTVALNVFSPAPGGGTSIPLTFAVSTQIVADASQTGFVMSNVQLGANLLNVVPDSGNPAYVPLLASAGIGLIRWPGGGESDFYHWQTNSYSSCATNTTGPSQGTFDTWMQNFVQPLGASVAITINNASNTDCSGPSDPNEAAAWVNYANNTQHYGIKYWTIGNEQYFPLPFDSAALTQTATTYATRVAKLFYPLMKAQDSSIQIGVDMHFGNALYDVAQDTWDSTVLANAKYDFVEMHYYPEYNNQDDDTLILTKWANQLATSFATAKSLLAANGHANTPIYLGEFDRDSGAAFGGIGHESVSVVDALFNAIVIGEVTKAGVMMATAWLGIDNCFADVAPVSTAYGWQAFGSFGLFAAGGTGFSLSCPDQGVPAQTPFPKARAFQILKQFVTPGEHVINVQSQDSLVRVYAATNASGYALLLINTDSVIAHTPSISITGAKSPSYTATSLTYGKQQYDLSKSGTWAGPAAFSLGTVSVSNFHVALPPWSITLVKLGP